jgi:hypothetical protein
MKTCSSGGGWGKGGGLGWSQKKRGHLPNIIFIRWNTGQLSMQLDDTDRRDSMKSGTHFIMN